MNKIVGIALIFCLIGMSSEGGERYRVQAKETIQETLAFADASREREIRVDNIFGSITVAGTEERDVQLVAHQTIKARNQEKITQAREEVRLDISRDGGLIDIYVDGPFRTCDREGKHLRRHDPGYEVHYDFELQVPRKTMLLLKTVTGGDIRVEAVEGEFEIHNVNGEISLSDIAGGGTAHTVNGEVTVRFVRPPEFDCSFHTVNGDIETVFPRGLSADFRLKTFNGDAYSAFPVVHLPAAAPETQKNNGKFIYKSNRFFGVRIGKGGPKIQMDTLNGDLLINQR